jgi:hypothetical protein
VFWKTTAGNLPPKLTAFGYFVKTLAKKKKKKKEIVCSKHKTKQNKKDI